MHFPSTVAIGLACLLQSGVYALPSGDAGAALEPNVTLVASEQVFVNGVPGLLESFLDTSALARQDTDVDDAVAPALERRCGGNRHTCSNTNRAQSAFCNSLINILKSRGDEKLSLKITSRCYTTPDGGCCTSWTKETSGNKLGYLVNGAVDLYKRCRKGNLVSGSMTDVNIGGVCQKQCLSVKNYCR